MDEEGNRVWKNAHHETLRIDFTYYCIIGRGVPVYSNANSTSHNWSTLSAVLVVLRLITIIIVRRGIGIELVGRNDLGHIEVIGGRSSDLGIERECC